MYQKIFFPELFLPDKTEEQKAEKRQQLATEMLEVSVQEVTTAAVTAEPETQPELRPEPQPEPQPEPEPEHLPESEAPTERFMTASFSVRPKVERKFDYFINHCHSSGQDQCTNLQKLLTADGASVCYDMQAQDLTMQAMEENVSQSRNMLIFLSDGVMGQPCCTAEQRWAKMYGCNLIGIVEKDSYSPAHFGKEKERAPADLKHILDEVEFLPYERRGYQVKTMISEIHRRAGVSLHHVSHSRSSIPSEGLPPPSARRLDLYSEPEPAPEPESEPEPEPEPIEAQGRPVTCQFSSTASSPAQSAVQATAPSPAAKVPGADVSVTPASKPARFDAHPGTATTQLEPISLNVDNAQKLVACICVSFPIVLAILTVLVAIGRPWLGIAVMVVWMRTILLDEMCTIVRLFADDPDSQPREHPTSPHPPMETVLMIMIYLYLFIVPFMFIICLIMFDWQPVALVALAWVARLIMRWMVWCICIATAIMRWVVRCTRIGAVVMPTMEERRSGHVWIRWVDKPWRRYTIIFIAFLVVGALGEPEPEPKVAELAEPEPKFAELASDVPRPWYIAGGTYYQNSTSSTTHYVSSTVLEISIPVVLYYSFRTL
eukprot:COSAG02_NODE_3862_length_6130_cov_2.580501_5_plen_603_part_00